MNHAARSSVANSDLLGQDMCAPGGSVLDLLDCAQDHRRGALHGAAHQVPRAIALLDLGKSPFGRHELAVGLVVMSQ
jgi:hypothetical protein